MRDDIYPQATVEALLDSDFVNDQTKSVLQSRLQKKVRVSPVFFSNNDFTLLEAVCDTLFPQIERGDKIPLAILLEDALVNSKGKGWRFDSLPPLKEAITKGLKGINEEARQIHDKNFSELLPHQKEQLLTTVQNDTAVAGTWKSLRADLFFTELLALLTELYYSHPIAKEEIGEVAFADVGGWKHIVLNNLEDREPKPINRKGDAAI